MHGETVKLWTTYLKEVI